MAKPSRSRQQVAWRAGVCVGTTASVCHPELLGDLHIHGALSALGAAGLQCGPAQFACGGLDGHACRCPATPFITICNAALVHRLTGSHALLSFGHSTASPSPLNKHTCNLWIWWQFVMQSVQTWSSAGALLLKHRLCSPTSTRSGPKLALGTY